MDNKKNSKLVTINYSGLDFTVDFSKRGVPDIYCRGRLLVPSFNAKLKRWYVNVYLGHDYDGVKGAYKHTKWDVAIYSVARYRIVAGAMEKMRTGEFDYEKFKGLQCDHIDGNPSNDTPSNLRFMTRKGNNSRKSARRLKAMNHRHTRRSDQIIKATNVQTGDVVLHRNGISCAQKLGCSHVLVYNVLNPEHFAKTAKGWKLEWVSLEDVVLKKDDLL